MNLRVSTAAALLLALATLPARAGKPVEQLLAEVQGDDLGLRIEAERELMDAGPGALEACRRVLAGTEDEETKVRLGRVVAWLAVDAATASLATAWKDRWYVVTDREGNRVGWEHSTAAETQVDGRRGWTFTSEAGLAGAADGPEYWKVVTTCRHDPILTPLKALVDAVNSDTDCQVEYEFREAEVATRLLALRRGNLGHRVRNRRTLPLELAVESPWTLDIHISALVERASLARTAEAEWHVFSVLESKSEATWLYAVTFAGEEEVEVRGKRYRARRYVHAASELRPEEEYWVDDAAGLVRMATAGLVVELADEAAAAPERPDPEKIEKQALAKAMAAVRGPAGEREAGELELLRRGAEALPACREALAAAPDDDARARLERVCRWLDPEFKRAELAEIWKDAWFVARDATDGGSWVGSEHVAVESTTLDGAPAWKSRHVIRLPAELRGDMPGKLSLESRSRADGMATACDARFWGKSRGEPFDVRIQFAPDAAWITSLKLGKTRQEPEDFADAIEVKGAGGRRWTLGSDVSRLVERASMARLPLLELRVADLLTRRGGGDIKVQLRRYRFAGEQDLEFGGAPAKVRRYVREGDGAGREEYLVEDARGLLVLDAGDLRFERTDEAGAKEPK